MRKFDLSKKVVAAVLTGTLALYTMPVFAASKDEVVYSKINGNNEDYSTIVSDKITNDQREEYINDLSNLLNIVNTSGDETFTQDGNKIVWNANGNSLSYQGDTEQELPIKTTVTYKLNGEEVTADELKGKEGRVSITVNYENLDEHNVKINGKTQKMYTPFIVVAGLLINKDNNENITVTKGKVVDNGKNAIAIGMALPGLQESLDLSKSDVDIPDSITFEMDATDFEMNNIISYVTPKLIEEADLDIFDDMDEIFDKANELQNASNKLVDGTTQLRDGISTLNNGTHELSNNLNLAINKYEATRKQLANKEKIENEIVKIVNDEFKKMLPGIEKDAETEAQKAISNHKTELENAVVDTSMKYTKQEEQELLNSINNSDKSILTEEQQKELEQAITKDIESVINEMQSDAQFQVLEKAVKDATINIVKQSVETTTKNVLNDEINTMETQMKQMSDVQKASQLEQMLSSTDSQTDRQYIKNLVTAETERLMKEQRLNAEEATSEATKEVYALLGDVSSKTMTTTLENVKSKGSTLSEKVVDETVKQIEQSTSTDKALKNAIAQYEQAIKANIAAKLGTTNQEILKQVENQMKQKVIDALKQELSKDQTLKQYGTVAREELNKKIDNVANSTAKELASKYTETIANEVANNMIKNALSGELSSSAIDKELSKYENVLNTTLNDVDSKVSTLRSALTQLTNGTEQLESGANTLADGMNQFNDEGISKIVNYINGDVKDLKERTEALKDLANKYNNFSGIGENTDGKVSFVIIVDNIKKDDE